MFMFCSIKFICNKGFNSMENSLTKAFISDSSNKKNV